MKSKTIFTEKDVIHIANLAKLSVTKIEIKRLAQGFNSVIEVVNKLFQLDVKKTKPVSQVTGLENVFRKDEVEPQNMLTQQQALSNAPRQYKGFFVVDQILED